MLPAEQRLRRAAEFSAVVRRGRRAGRRRVVVHVLDGPGARRSRPRAGQGAPGAVVRDAVVRDAVVRHGGSRLGLVVSTAVGGAVVRHRVARRLRHVMVALLPQLPEGTDVVLRALPDAATASSAELEVDVRAGLGRLDLLGARS